MSRSEVDVQFSLRGDHGYGANRRTIEYLAAPLADKVLKGTPAGTIPVVSDESFLQINYTVAQKLGVEVPEGLLSQADEVIR